MTPLPRRFSNRQMWSFARDKAFPFSNTWAKVNTRLGVPLNAHIACNAIVVLLGALYVASATAFNSLVIGVIIFQYLSYSVPIVLLLIRGRNTIPHGPFWLGKFGFFCNIVTYVSPLTVCANHVQPLLDRLYHDILLFPGGYARRSRQYELHLGDFGRIFPPRDVLVVRQRTKSI
jgi:amino acid transporter